MAADDRGCTDPDHPKEASFGGPQCPSCGMTGPDPRSTDEEECTHPNGFGTTGCACGATRPADDEAPTEGVAYADYAAVPSPHRVDKVMARVLANSRSAANEEARAAAAFVPPEGVEHLSREEAVSAAQRFSNLASTNPIPGLVKLVEDAEAADELIATVDKFTDWWRTMVSSEAPVIARKAQEYGSNSLAAMGRLYARGQGREVDPAEALELGCYFYAYGKMQRVADAMIKGKLPSTDTLKDTMIYMAMAQYIRQFRQWP